MENLRQRYISCSFWRSTFCVVALLLLVFHLSIASLAVPVEAAGLTPFRVSSSSSTGQTSSITINRPLGTLAGDVMIAAITILSPSSGITFTSPTDWTAVRQDIASGELAQALFYKVSTGVSEPADYTFGHNQSLEASGVIASYWGIDPINPINADGGQFNPGSTPTAPSITTTAAGTTLLAIFGTKNGTVLDPPTNMVERWQQTGTNGIQGFDELFTGSGASGNRTSGTTASATIGQLIALRPESPSAAGTVLYPTRNAGSFTAAEQVRVDLISSWGYTIRPIAANATPAEIAPELAIADAVYIAEEVKSNDIVNNYTASCVGVINEEPALVDNLLLANNTSGTANQTDVNINNTSHYITQNFLLGPLTLFTIVGNNQMRYLTGIATGATGLAYYPDGTTGDLTLTAYEIGVNLTDNSAAAGRRVALPWGSNMDEAEILNLTANGQQMIRRSIEWAMASNNCYTLTKKAFLPDGTLLADGASLPVGSKIHFLLYLDNTKATAINDLNISDLLAPTFQYTPIASGGMLKVDNSVATGASETTIYTAVSSAPNLTEDIVNGSLVAGYTPGSTTISAGTDAGNATLNIAANKIWAMLFEVTLQP